MPCTNACGSVFRAAGQARLPVGGKKYSRWNPYSDRDAMRTDLRDDIVFRIYIPNISNTAKGPNIEIGFDADVISSRRSAFSGCKFGLLLKMVVSPPTRADQAKLAEKGEF